MFISQKTKLFFLIGDIIVFYISLFLALVIRYRGLFSEQIWQVHNIPFIFIHGLWILIFYINSLYDLRSFTSRKMIFEKIGKSMAVAGIFAILIFYLVPSFKITPKTNLLLDIIIVAALLSLWRRSFFLFAVNSSKIRILFYGITREAIDIINYIKHNPQMGYDTIAISTDKNLDDFGGFSDANLKNKIKIFGLQNSLTQIIKENNIHIVVFSEDITHNNFALNNLYKVLPLGVSVLNFTSFYESVLEKVPISIISEYWFLENLNEPTKKTSEVFKRMFDIFFAVFLGVITSEIMVIAAVMTKFTRGKVFYSQRRVGKNGKVFNLVKFGSMVINAEKEGVKWAEKNDPRITKFGKFIRKTRIDELPQLWNIFKGDMSFVGPRPERPEFIKELEEKIPHYLMRNLVKPGLSGWAQIKFPYGASVRDAMEKLQYDLYYIKNKNLLFDIAITLKTLAIIAKREGV